MYRCHSKHPVSGFLFAHEKYQSISDTPEKRFNDSEELIVLQSGCNTFLRGERRRRNPLTQLHVQPILILFTDGNETPVLCAIIGCPTPCLNICQRTRPVAVSSRLPDCDVQVCDNPDRLHGDRLHSELVSQGSNAQQQHSAYYAHLWRTTIPAAISLCSTIQAARCAAIVRPRK